MQNYTGAVIDQSGNVVPGASVQVYKAGSVAPATIYSDDGVTAIANPMTVDSYGRFSFWAGNGKYDIYISGPGIASYTVRYQELYDGVTTSPLVLPLMGSWISTSLVGSPSLVRTGDICYITGSIKGGADGTQSFQLPSMHYPVHNTVAMGGVNSPPTSSSAILFLDIIGRFYVYNSGGQSATYETAFTFSYIAVPIV